MTNEQRLKLLVNTMSTAYGTAVYAKHTNAFIVDSDQALQYANEQHYKYLCFDEAYMTAIAQNAIVKIDQLANDNASLTATITDLQQQLQEAKHPLLTLIHKLRNLMFN